ncbi:MAG: aldehyde dehydrogenase family protein [Rhodobacteraceae bacterium]|nr:aldehyde dehydrogenase family protein [Paracoccaceae bacterium]TVR47502.1 MAG: aldehyde dehydrogenase family protein [Paracoccaceae bacterium]
MARAVRLSEGLEFGMVGLNTGILSNEVVPFGGVRASGLGRYGWWAPLTSRRNAARSATRRLMLAAHDSGHAARPWRRHG